MKTHYLKCLIICGTVVHFAADAAAQITPGLLESRYSGRYAANPNNVPDPTSVDHRVVPAPYGANAWGDLDDPNNPYLDNNQTGDVNYTVPGSDGWPPEYGGWSHNTTFRYTGYIHIPEGSNTVTFVSQFNNAKCLFIDDVIVYQNDTWNGLGSATVYLATGWHKFDLRNDLTSGDFGPHSPWVGWTWHPDKYGFAIDWNGSPTSQPANFVFPIDPGDGSLFSATRPPGLVNFYTPAATQIDQSSATFSVSLATDAYDSGTLWLCYGSGIPPVFTTNGWEFAPVAWSGGKIMHTDNDPQTYAFPVSGLSSDTEYHYMFAFESDAKPGVFHYMPTTAKFSTSDPGLPGVYIYGAQINATLDWDVPGVWVPLNGSARTVPGIAGDTVTPAANAANPGTVSPRQLEYRHHNLANDITLGTIVTGFGGRIEWWEYNSFAVWRPTTASGPVTITLDASPARAYSRIQLGASRRFFIGNEIISADTTLRLTQPLTVHKGSYNDTDFYLNALVTGGTEQEPFPITIVATDGNEGLRVAPRNPGNDFVGDIILVSTWPRVALHIGAAMEDNLPGHNSGMNSWGPNDGYMGHPSNRIIMTHPSCRLAIEAYGANDDFPLNRTVIGNGMVRASKMPWWSREEEDSRHNLNLGPRCVLSPGFDAADVPVINAGISTIAFQNQWNWNPPPPVAAGVGTLTLRGTNLNMDSDTRVVIRVAVADDVPVNDRLVLQFSGTINFAGVLDVAQFDPEVRIPAGTEWTVMTTTAPTAFTGKFKNAIGYSVVYETDGSGALEAVKLVKLSMATLIIVK